MKHLDEILTNICTYTKSTTKVYVVENLKVDIYFLKKAKNTFLSILEVKIPRKLLFLSFIYAKNL